MSDVKDLRHIIGHPPLLVNYFIPLALICAQDGKCFYCGGALRGPQTEIAPDPRCWTRDHVTPLIRGGSNKRNRVIACYTCNQEKGDRKPTGTELRDMAQVHERAYRWLEAFGKLPPGVVEAARAQMRETAPRAEASS